MRLNGGMIHFCGKGDHFISAVSEIEGLYAVDLSQPELNNMDVILNNTIDKNINLHTNANGRFLERVRRSSHKLYRLSV